MPSGQVTIGGYVRSKPSSPFDAIARQTATGLGWTVVALLVGFSAKLVLARKMPPHAMGTVMAAQSFVGLALAVTGLGIPDAVVRFVGLEANAAAAPRRTVSVALKIAAGTAVPATVLVLAALLGWFGAAMTSEALWTTVILTASLPLLAVGDVLGAAYRGVNRLGTKLLLIDVVRPGFVVLALLIAPVMLTQHASFVAAMYAAAALLIAGAFWVLFVRDARWRNLGASGAGDLLRFGLPIAGAALIAGPLVNNALPLMLSAWPGPTAVALYTVALSLQAVVYLPIGVLEQAVIPTWARMTVPEMREPLAASYRQFTNLGFAGATVIGLVFFANDQAILSLMFGPTYALAGWVLRIAIVAALFAAFTGPNDAMLRALGLATSIFKARTAAALAGLSAAAALIPGYGLTGGIVAFAITSVVVNGLEGMFVYRARRIHPFTRPHAMTAVMAVVGLLMATILADSHPLGTWVAVHVIAVLVAVMNADLRLAVQKLVLP